VAVLQSGDRRASGSESSPDISDEAFGRSPVRHFPRYAWRQCGVIKKFAFISYFIIPFSTI
jgi:hypothetical protein